MNSTSFYCQVEKLWPDECGVLGKAPKDAPLALAKTKVNDGHAKVMKAIEEFSNDELFFKKRFSWTGSSSLGSYCVSATSSRYDWAVKKLKQYIKSRK